MLEFRLSRTFIHSCNLLSGDFCVLGKRGSQQKRCCAVSLGLLSFRHDKNHATRSDELPLIKETFFYGHARLAKCSQTFSISSLVYEVETRNFSFLVNGFCSPYNFFLYLNGCFQRSQSFNPDEMSCSECSYVSGGFSETRMPFWCCLCRCDDLWVQFSGKKKIFSYLKVLEFSLSPIGIACAIPLTFSSMS